MASLVAGGDCVTGPKFAINAIAGGKEGAIGWMGDYFKHIHPRSPRPWRCCLGQCLPLGEQFGAGATGPLYALRDRYGVDVAFVDALPLNASGKLLKTALRSTYA